MAMQFLKGLTRWFHFDRKPTTIESSKPIQEVPAERQQLVTRRNLLFGLGATAIVAAMPEIPFGRVWSFPRIIRTGFADPGRIDMLNLAAWDKYPWDAQSVALQLEKVRHQLPLLYEDNDAMFGLISRFRPEPVSARAVRLPLPYLDADGTLGRGTGFTVDYFDGPPMRISGDDGSHGPFLFDTPTQELTLADAKRMYPPHILPAGDIPGALNLEIPVPNLKTEAGKVSRLVDRYGNALAQKVDRTVVKPLRDELESVCDLVNNG